MGRILITLIALYLLFVVCYLAWERGVKRRRNAARRKGGHPFRPAPVEDIIGKSQFDLRHSLPQATTLTESEKRLENTSTFAAGNEKTDEPKPSAMVPKEKLDEVFSSAQVTDSATSPATAHDSDTDDVDYAFDDRPDGEEQTEPAEADTPDGYSETVDAEESDDGEEGEYADDETAHAGAMATGLKFDELSGMSRTVNDPDAATARERHEAGRVLTEVRQTDMFEQVVSGRPEKQTTAGRLMDEYMTEWRRKRREAGGDDEPGVKAPDGFDPRAFAR